MKRILSIVICLFAYAALASAQKFMDHIEQTVEGKGSVKIHQDTLLTMIINGDFIPKEDKKEADDSEKNFLKIKKRGYRIQVFKGGNTRSDEAAARKVGDNIQKQFEELDVYIIYNNPEWVCRVGDFKSRDEALELLNKIKTVSRSAMIVPSEIYVKEQ
jgi:hypothetical protein